MLNRVKSVWLLLLMGFLLTQAQVSRAGWSEWASKLVSPTVLNCAEQLGFPGLRGLQSLASESPFIFTEFLGQLTTLIQQSGGILSPPADLISALTGDVPGMTTRLASFSVDLNAIRATMTVPLMGSLETISADFEDKAKREARLGVLAAYLLEMRIAVAKVAPGKKWSLAEKVKEPVRVEVPSTLSADALFEFLLTTFLRPLGSVVFHDEMEDKLKGLEFIYRELSAIMGELRQISGWENIDQEVEAWRANHQGTPAEESQPATEEQPV